MRIRQNDPITNDWTFGNGQNNYLVNNDAVAQLIKTRILSFLNDCFYAVTEGIDWLNFIGSKNQVGLKLAITSTILNTPNVTGLLQLDLNLSSNRVFFVSFRVQTTYSTTGGTFTFDVAQ